MSLFEGCESLRFPLLRRILKNSWFFMRPVLAWGGGLSGQIDVLSIPPLSRRHFLPYKNRFQEMSLLLRFSPSACFVSKNCLLSLSVLFQIGVLFVCLLFVCLGLVALVFLVVFPRKWPFPPGRTPFLMSTTKLCD